LLIANVVYYVQKRETITKIPTSVGIMKKATINLAATVGIMEEHYECKK